MHNPYQILGVPQDANASQIVKAQVKALRAKKYTMKEVTEAQITLRKPSSRLAADFTFPILVKGKLESIMSHATIPQIDVNSLNPNKYDSLR